MIRKLSVLGVCAAMAISSCGCAVLVVGAAAGVGTAYWLGSKMTQDVNVPFARASRAARRGLESLRMPINREMTSADTAQYISQYSDGRTVWVDVKKTSEAASRIEVRVGTTEDKETATRILDAIKRYF